MSEGKIIARRREDRPEVLYLVLSNPRALNALTEEMQIDLIDKLRAARDDKSVRCVVLRGEGDRAFSSGGQVQSLEKWGIHPDEIECAGKASLLLDRLAKRRSEGLTTPKQIRCLEQRGFRHVGQWRFEEASHMIDRIASQGWKTPAGVTPSAYVPVSMGG